MSFNILKCSRPVCKPFTDSTGCQVIPSSSPYQSNGRNGSSLLTNAFSAHAAQADGVWTSSAPSQLESRPKKHNTRARRQTQGSFDYSDIAFNMLEYRHALNSENVVTAVKLVRQLIQSVQGFESRVGIAVERNSSGTLKKLSAKGSHFFANLLNGLHHQFFKICLRKRNLDAALEYARVLPPDRHVFTVLLKACVDHGSLTAVTRAVEVRKAVGLKEDAFCYTALLKAASRAKKAATMDSLFEEAWSSGVRDASIFNVLISHQNKQRHFKAAFATFDRMIALGMEPDGVTMNLLIQAAGMEGRFEKVVQLYRQMQAVGPPPTSHTFVQLFAAFHNSHKKDPDWIFQVYDDMLAAGVQPITQHFVTFLVGASEASLSTHQIQQAFLRSLQFCKANGGEGSIYSSLLKFCVSQGVPEKAVEVWRQIQTEDHEVDTWVFNSLFAACAAYNSPELRIVMTEAYRKLEAYREDVMLQPKLQPKTLTGLTLAFNSLLNACAKCSMITAAEDIFQSMQTHGPAPDLVSYNTILAGYAQVSDTEKAFSIFHSLCELSSQPHAARLHLRPNVQTFGALLNCCARAGNVHSAKRILELMRIAGIPPSAEAYTSLIHSCVKEGSDESIDYAFQVFDHMKLEGVYPTAVTYGCLMNACEAADRVDDAFNLYQEACANGVPPSDGCHNILINAFAKNNRLEEALNVVKTLARRKGRHFQAGALNSLVRALAPEHIQKALRMLSFVRTLKLKVHSDTLSVVLACCAQSFMIEEAHAIYWELSKEGAMTTCEAGSYLIMALCRANQKERALEVFEDMIRAGKRSALPTRPRHSRPSLELTAAEQLGLRDSLESGGALDNENPSRSPGQAAESRANLDNFKSSRRNKKAVFPHARAMSALVQAYAATDLDRALYLYKELQKDSVGVAAVTLSNRYMWQSLIEAACRTHRLDAALKIFDDWKAYCGKQTALHRFDEDARLFVPRLSYATLAYLEACCRLHLSVAEPSKAAQYEMRVFDVCATMRQLQDQKSQASLPHPQKKSHHFAELS